jgi:hypothetical protein
MTDSARAKLVHRILGGVLRLELASQVYHLHAPTPFRRYCAEEAYESALIEAREQELFEESHLLAWMMDAGLWSTEQAADLGKYIADIEEMKVRAFEANFRSADRKTLQKTLAFAKGEVVRLSRERHAFDHLSVAGHANAVRLRYLVGAGLCDRYDRPVWLDDDFWQHPSSLLDEALEVYLRQQVAEDKIRLLARTEPFRSYWTARKACGSLLGLDASRLSDEQRSLVVWADLYDMVYQHPDCPATEVVEDDDLLDGWFIVQRRKRGQLEPSKVVGNEKIAGMDEVFVAAQTNEDLARVEALNSPAARAKKAQRLTYLAKHGEVKEADMPDTRQNLRNQLADLEVARARSKG